MANPRALIVDDEPDLCELLSLTLARMGVDSHAVHDLASARRELQSGQDYALCLTDLRLPDGDGTSLIEWIQSEAPELPVAVITAHGHVESAVLALKLGAFDFVRKPVDIADLRSSSTRRSSSPTAAAAPPADAACWAIPSRCRSCGR